MISIFAPRLSGATAAEKDSPALSLSLKTISFVPELSLRRCREQHRARVINRLAWRERRVDRAAFGKIVVVRANACARL